MTFSPTEREPEVLRWYAGQNLLQIAMPLGGIGAGSVCFNGTGGLQDFSIRNRPGTTALPDGHGFSDAAFALLHVRGNSPVTRLIEGPLSPEKLYDQGLQAQGYRHGGHEGLPRFSSCTFGSGYPFGIVKLDDNLVPLDVTVTAWSPFIPNDDLSSGMPAAILEYRFENNAATPVEFDFSYHLSHLAGEASDRKSNHWSKTRCSVISGRGVLFDNILPVEDENYGTATVQAVGWTPKIKAMWLRGGWFDAISGLWREVSTGKFRENDGKQIVDDLDSRSGGSIMASAVLAPGENIVLPVVIAWHFPNSNLSVGGISSSEPECGPGCDCSDLISIDPADARQRNKPVWHPFYAGAWKDATDVGDFIANNYADMRARTLSFADALLSSTLPEYVLDAVSSNLAILKSPTVLRQENGNVWAWEGCFCEGGCCHGSCTHVWNYAQAMPHLFPKLERTFRNQELQRSMDDLGHINFRAALPDGPVSHDFHPAADGQLGGVLKLYRDWTICGDKEWLESLYLLAKRSLDYCISIWDPDRRGGLFEPHHNTYDIEFWGPNGMCGSIYVAALSAMAKIAGHLGRIGEADEYSQLASTGAKFMSDTLFNGQYYQQNVQWLGLRNTTFADSIATLEGPMSEMKELLRDEGPKYQYGSGCLSDGIIGAWMAAIYGVETPLIQDQVRSTLKSIYQNNYKDDLFEHACLQRPGYALGHEKGLLLCTWPRGGKPTLPFVYSDEIWTGIEYQVASHLIEEGFVEEGLTVVSAARSRYDGHVRNPFNEYECGSYYARAMASYALLSSLSGFRYSAVDGTLFYGPKLVKDCFKSFFSTAFGFGTIMLTDNKLTIKLIEGELQIVSVVVTRNGRQVRLPVDRRAVAGSELEIALEAAV
jgi:uncharacterized protein (DUF608 family)